MYIRTLNIPLTSLYFFNLYLSILFLELYSYDFHQPYNVSIICFSLSSCLSASLSLSLPLLLSLSLSHSVSRRLSVVAVAVAVGGHLTSSTMLISCPLPYAPPPSLLPRGVRPLSSLSLVKVYYNVTTKVVGFKRLS